MKISMAIVSALLIPCVALATAAADHRAYLTDDEIAHYEYLKEQAEQAKQASSNELGDVSGPIVMPKQFWVCFDANGGSGTMEPFEDRVLGNVIQFTLPECQFARDGWEFAGWSDIADDTTAKWDAGDTIWLQDSLTLYAIWSRNVWCAVGFDLNDGSGAMCVVLVVKGSTCPAVETTLPKRDGYKFLGWFTHPNGGVRATRETIVESDVTWYAHWDSEDSHDDLTSGFNGNAPHTFNGLVYDSSLMCGMIQITTAKATAKGVSVSGSVILEDGKKQAIKAATAQVSGGYLKISSTVGKLGKLSLTIGANGFKGTIGGMSVATADIDEGTGIISATVKMQYFDAKTGKIKTKSYKMSGITSGGEAVGSVSLKNEEKTFEAVID